MIYVKGYTTHNVKDLYEEYGRDLGLHIRGDFFIEIQDLSNNTLTRISDFAGSKCSGKFPRNTTMVTNLKTNDLIYCGPTIPRHYIIEPKSQNNSSYDRIFNAIENSISIRIPERTPILTLSSGYDSGVIACAVDSMGIDYDIITIPTNEDKDVLNKRLDLLSYRSVTIVDNITEEDLKSEFDQIGFESNFSVSHPNYAVARLSKGRTVLSGMGADELIFNEDYELLSNFLESGDHIYSKMGIDIRYPLLDPTVIREYNSLKPELRRRYKQPFEKYLASHNCPFTPKKIGFNIWGESWKPYLQLTRGR